MKTGTLIPGQSSSPGGLDGKLQTSVHFERGSIIEPTTTIRTQQPLDQPNKPHTKRKWAGGPDTHKPGCQCRACKARRRHAETELGGDGSDSPSEGLQKLPRKHIDSKNGGRYSKAVEADWDPIVVKVKSARMRVAEWAAMRAMDPNITNIEAAKRMGISPSTLNTMISRAAKEGWLIFDNPYSKIEHIVVPQTVDNLIGFLKEGDRTVTIEAAKGIVFPGYKDSRGIQENKTNILALKFEFPAGTSTPKETVIEGQIIDPNSSIVGKPNIFIDPPNAIQVSETSGVHAHQPPGDSEAVGQGIRDEADRRVEVSPQVEEVKD